MFLAYQQAQAKARTCDGHEVPSGLRREILTLMGCVCLCYVPTFFFFFLAEVWGQSLLVAALGSTDRSNFINGEKAGMAGVYSISE